MVSIIIPVYNCESYLRKCLMSILQQSYTEIEIIVIDDGSQDGSLKICKEMEATDNRIRVFHQNNCGVSVARNIGLSFARGEYIAFVDGDDWIERDYIKVLLNDMKKFNADMSVCGIFRENLDGEVFEKTNYSCGNILNKDDAIYSALRFDGFQGYLCNKLFKREKILLKSLKLNEKISILEDLLFVIQYLNASECIVVNNQPLYHYVNHDDSARQSCSKAICFQQKWLTEIDALSEIINELENKTLKNYAKAKKVLSCSFYLKRMYACDYHDKNIESKLIKYIRKNLFWVWRFKLGDWKWRLTTYACAISPKMDFLLRKCFKIGN